VEELFLRRRALALWQEGQDLHLEGDLPSALERYARSIAVFPTAEAYTFRGWAYSFEQRYEEAIAECKQAIAVDPTLGNPYNDIGSYLMALGRLDEAVGWLEKAKAAPRYDARHFPYVNLGRLHAARGEIGRALAELEGALRLKPQDRATLAEVVELRRRVH
jgi:tetratricopeptide (TPR) repeat protein